MKISIHSKGRKSQITTNSFFIQILCFCGMHATSENVGKRWEGNLSLTDKTDELAKTNDIIHDKSKHIFPHTSSTSTLLQHLIIINVISFSVFCRNVQQAFFHKLYHFYIRSKSRTQLPSCSQLCNIIMMYAFKIQNNWYYHIFEKNYHEVKSTIKQKVNQALRCLTIVYGSIWISLSKKISRRRK